MKILNDLGGFVEAERNGKFVEWITNVPCDDSAVIISVNFEGIMDIDQACPGRKPKKQVLLKTRKS